MTDGALSDEAKAFVVQSLACFDAPSLVAAAVKRDFGFDVTRQAIQAYDPTKTAGAGIPDKWREVFERTRAAFLDETATIGIASRTVRLRRLERLADKAEAQGNTALAAQLLVQAAKEVGDVYTNRQRIDASHTVLSHEDALSALERGDG